MKTGNSLRRWKFLTAGLTVMTLGMSGILPVSASSMLSVTDEAQIRPINDGSEKYLMKSDGFYCLKVMEVRMIQQQFIILIMSK